MKISYAITVCNELEEIQRLVPFLKENKRHNDEVVILYDHKNGDEEVAKYTDLISMSPKLSSSTPWAANLKDSGVEYNEKWAEKHEKLRRNISTIQSFIDGRKHFENDFQLKFVIAQEQDIEEIESILSELTGWEPSDICLMPEGVDVDTLNKRTGWVAEQALIRGWRFTPRLHVMMFGKNRFV